MMVCFLFFAENTVCSELENTLNSNLDQFLALLRDARYDMYMCLTLLPFLSECNWFSLAGKTFLTEPLCKKTFSPDGKTRRAKSTPQAPAGQFVQCPALTENKHCSLLPFRFLNRCQLYVKRYLKSTGQLPVVASLSLPVVNLGDHKLSQLSKHKLYIQFRRHPSYCLVSIH